MLAACGVYKTGIQGHQRQICLLLAWAEGDSQIKGEKQSEKAGCTLIRALLIAHAEIESFGPGLYVQAVLISSSPLKDWGAQMTA